MSHEECPCCRHFFLFFVNDESDLELFEGRRASMSHAETSGHQQHQQASLRPQLRRSEAQRQLSSDRTERPPPGNATLNTANDDVVVNRRSGRSTRDESGTGILGLLGRFSSQEQEHQQQQQPRSGPSESGGGGGGSSNARTNNFSETGSVNSVLERMMSLFEDFRRDAAGTPSTPSSSPPATANVSNSTPRPSVPLTSAAVDEVELPESR